MVYGEHGRWISVMVCSHHQTHAYFSLYELPVMVKM